MAERTGVITFKGNPMTLVGPEIKVGDTLPAFKVTGQDLGDITNKDFVDKVLVLSVVPSVDTPVCALQTKTFFRKASTVSNDVVILTVSLDLPFAAKRFCAAEGIETARTGSDYKHRSFGKAFGVTIKELGLLTRAVFVAGKDGKVKHAEYVSEVTNEPDYEAALAAVKAAL
jgi:thiol peroxidase